MFIHAEDLITIMIRCMGLLLDFKLKLYFFNLKSKISKKKSNLVLVTENTNCIRVPLLN